MIRILLTYDMRGFNAFVKKMVDKIKPHLQQEQPHIKVIDFVNAVKESITRPLSIFTNVYTYDTIIKDIEKIKGWQDIVKTNISKLYYLFKNYPSAYIYTMKAKSFNSEEVTLKNLKYDEVGAVNI